MKKSLVLFAALVFFLSGCSLAPQNLVQTPSTDSQNKNQKQATACTEEAKICPDGSSVGRTEVNCEFATCPAIQKLAEEKPVAGSESKVYENKYMKFTLSNGWTATLGTEASAVSIIKDKYILYINTKAEQVSGVLGGRADEITSGAPSADAVITDGAQGLCGSSETYPASIGQKRIDSYVSTKGKQEWCVSPSNGSAVWYFSYITGSAGGYFNYYKSGSGPIGWVITMAYNSKDVNKLPIKGSPTLKAKLNEMTAIVKSLEIKQE